MDEFDGIPAVGDGFVDESRIESLNKCVDSEAPLTKGKFPFNGRYIHVTWLKSTVVCKEEFRWKLLAMLPEGVGLFGRRQLHEDGTADYYVVFSFQEKHNWPDARKHFMIDGDVNAIRLDKPKPRQRISDFLENTMAYCAKEGDTFGERLSMKGAASEQKKRKWPEIIDEEDVSKARGMVRELDSRADMLNHGDLPLAMAATKRSKVEDRSRKICGDFCVPRLMELLMDKYVIRRD